MLIEDNEEILNNVSNSSKDCVNEFQCFYTNVDSLTNKIDELPKCSEKQQI